ncbi:MAG: hypothetical protein HY319_06690 [Armatimonadetes bacterium]|nr:hypothetical protein [Armatimonadota bacterium]
MSDQAEQSDGASEETQAWVARVRNAPELKAQRAAIAYMLDALQGQPQTVLAILGELGELHRNYAVERTQDQDVLAAVARSDFGAAGRRVAVRRLEDRQALLQVVEEDPEPSVRETAFAKLEELGEPVDPELLKAPPRARAMIATTTEDELEDVGARKSRAERSTNPQTLAEFATRDPDPGVRLVALRKLQSKDVLEEIAANDSDENVRGFAASRLRALGLVPRSRRQVAAGDPPGAVAEAVTDAAVEAEAEAEDERKQRRKSTSRGADYNPSAGFFGRVVGVIFRRVRFQLPNPTGPGSSRDGTNLEDLRRAGAAFRKILMVTAALAVCLVVIGGAYLHHRDNQAETYLAEGTQRLAKGDPRAVLWFARAVAADPSSRNYRAAAAKGLLLEPSLIFLQQFPGKWKATSVASDGSLLAVSPEGDVTSLKGRAVAAVRARFAAWDPAQDGILYIGTDGALYLREDGAVQRFTAPSPLKRAWRGSDGGLLAASDQVLYRASQGKLIRALEIEGLVADVSADLGRAVSLEERQARLWSVKEKSTLRVLPAEPGRRWKQISLLPDGRGVSCIDDSGTATVWEGGPGWSALKLPEYTVWSRFTPDGKHLLAGTKDGIGAWDPAGRKTLLRIRTPEPTLAATMDPECRFLAVLSESGIGCGPAGLLALSRQPLPDWDQPPELLELEAQLYSGARLGEKDGETIPADILARLGAEWEESAAHHARECQCPDGNLWILYRGAP